MGFGLPLFQQTSGSSLSPAVSPTALDLVQFSSFSSSFLTLPWLPPFPHSSGALPLRLFEFFSSSHRPPPQKSHPWSFSQFLILFLFLCTSSSPPLPLLLHLYIGCFKGFFQFLPLLSVSVFLFVSVSLLAYLSFSQSQLLIPPSLSCSPLTFFLLSSLSPLSFSLSTFIHPPPFLEFAV